MLMMWATLLAFGSRPTTDAHDAVSCAGVQGTGPLLILMMWATCFLFASRPTTDAHDAEGAGP